MKTQNDKHRILILGATGFIGNALYRELCSYFKTFGTYQLSKKSYKSNNHLFQYRVEEDDIYEILENIRPSIIISCLRGNFHAQVIAHQHLSEYVATHDCKMIFFSSANVFDAYSKYPSYEDDKTLSDSIYGHFKIKIENMFLRLPKNKVVIIRLPMVFGTHSPRLKEIKQHIVDKTPIEVFPNLIMNVTTDFKISQQVHYIINRDKHGIFHLGSVDLVHHDDFIKEITEVITPHPVSFKQVYTTNEDRYLAVIPKTNKLPDHLQISSVDLLDELNNYINYTS